MDLPQAMKPFENKYCSQFEAKKISKSGFYPQKKA